MSRKLEQLGQLFEFEDTTGSKVQGKNVKGIFSGLDGTGAQGGRWRKRRGSGDRLETYHNVLYELRGLRPKALGNHSQFLRKEATSQVLTAFVWNRFQHPPWRCAPRQFRITNEKAVMSTVCVSPAPGICTRGIFHFIL